MSDHRLQQVGAVRAFHCRVFNWRSNLNVHMRTHDAHRTRDFICPVPNCGKSFFDMQHLKQHQQIHTRSANVLLSIARDIDVYLSLPWLQQEVLDQGGSAAAYQEPPSGKGDEGVIGEIDKKFKCDVIGCDKAFVRRTDLKIHKLRVHTDVKPHVCTFPSCDKVSCNQWE